MENTKRGRQGKNKRQGENTVLLTTVYLPPSRTVSLLSIFRSFLSIARLLLSLAWLQTQLSSPSTACLHTQIAGGNTEPGTGANKGS